MREHLNNATKTETHTTDVNVCVQRSCSSETTNKTENNQFENGLFSGPFKTDKCTIEKLPRKTYCAAGYYNEY